MHRTQSTDARGCLHNIDFSTLVPKLERFHFIKCIHCFDKPGPCSQSLEPDFGEHFDSPAPVFCKKIVTGANIYGKLAGDRGSKVVGCPSLR